MSPEDLRHQEFVELVTDYLEGALSPPEQARFERHLAACSGCGAYFEQMRMTIRLVGALRTEAIPEDAWRRLLAAFRDWKRGRGSSA
jgi:anti-sigma factor RsiW